MIYILKNARDCFIIIRTFTYTRFNIVVYIGKRKPSLASIVLL